MKGASVKVAILSFFSSHGLYFHHAKNQPPLRPPSPFSEHLPLFWPYLFSKKFYETFLVQNLGHNHLKKCNICCLGGLLKEKRESTSDLFSTFQKPYRPSCPIVQWCLDCSDRKHRFGLWYWTNREMMWKHYCLKCIYTWRNWRTKKWKSCHPQC